MNPQPGRQLALETYLGHPILNGIDADPTPGLIAFNRRQYEPLLRNLPQTGPATGRYNCHGLVFASRRTGIPAPAQESRGLIDRILQEDQFHPIAEEQAREGDVAIWRKSADIDHTGLVVFVQRDIAPRALLIWSMWGGLGEFVHPVGRTPYPDCTVEYWRLGDL